MPGERRDDRIRPPHAKHRAIEVEERQAGRCGGWSGAGRQVGCRAVRLVAMCRVVRSGGCAGMRIGSGRQAGQPAPTGVTMPDAWRDAQPLPAERLPA
jgi:hypothetical protein